MTARASLLLLLLLLCGCARVTQENYDRLRNGMSPSEVADILGPPTKTDGAAAGVGSVSLSGSTHLWESDGRKITVTFVNDKLVLKTKDGF